MSLLLGKDRSNLEIIHMLALMGTAGFRLIPSFSRILTNLQAIRFGWASVDVISAEFSKSHEDILKDKSCAQESSPRQITFEEDITFENLSFSYDGEKKTLDDIDLQISLGDRVGVVGESGSGKSTFACILMGLLSPTKGEIRIDQNLLDKENLGIWQSMIGYVPQEVFLLDDTLRRNIAWVFLIMK